MGIFFLLKILDCGENAISVYYTEAYKNIIKPDNNLVLLITEQFSITIEGKDESISIAHQSYALFIDKQTEKRPAKLSKSYLFLSDKLNLFSGFFKVKVTDLLIVTCTRANGHLHTQPLAHAQMTIGTCTGDDKEYSLKRDKEWRERL